MDKESPLKIDICNRPIARLFVAEATIEADTWVCRWRRG